MRETDHSLGFFNNPRFGEGLDHTLCIHMPTSTPQQFDPAAAIAGIIFPGAGHMLRKKVSRGIFAAVGVFGLFIFGLLIGGIDAIDSKEDKIWFYGQALAGPMTFAVDYVHQSNYKGFDPVTEVTRTGYPSEHRVFQNNTWEWVEMTQGEIDQGMGPPNTKALGRLNEIAMLSIVLAGMLNVIIVIDALMPRAEGNPKPATKESDQ
jgi:TM2 domain-containing membrane protein YozV